MSSQRLVAGEDSVPDGEKMVRLMTELEKQFAE